MTSRYPILIAALLLAGCAARQRPATNWVLRTGDGGQVLVPPSLPQGQSVVLRNARSVRRGGPACNLSGGDVQLTWRGRTARVALSQAAVAPSSDVTVSGGPVKVVGTLLRDLDWWPRFTDELYARVKAGCLTEGDVKSVTARVIENVAMPSNVAYQLRYGNYMLTGYVDVEPEFALSSVAPLLKPGVKAYRTPDDIAGYETIYYDVTRRAGGGVKISVRSVERNIQRKVTQVRRPATEVIKLPDSARYARYYFRMWNVKGDRKLAILATSSPDRLTPMSKRFEADPEGFCKSVKPSEATCITVPGHMMIVPELKVSLNGKPAYLLVGGTIGNLLRTARVKDPKEILSRIQVLRPYDGLPLPVEFDRSNPGILGFTPIGGEQISW
jgi:hypothetical protein